MENKIYWLACWLVMDFQFLQKNWKLIKFLKDEGLPVANLCGEWEWTLSLVWVLQQLRIGKIGIWAYVFFIFVSTVAG